MIAITNTEPIPINPVAVKDLPQIQQLEEDNDEKPEQTSFAELLAGLLYNSEKAPEVPIKENFLGEAEPNFSEVTFGGIELKDMQKYINEVDFSENPSDVKVPAEDLNVILGTQRLFSDLGEIAKEANEGDFYRDLSNLIRTDLVPEADVDTDFFEVLSNGKNQNNLNIQQTAAAVNNEQNESAETGVKKDSTQKLSNLIENKERTEETAMLRARPENEKLGKLEETRNAALRNRTGRDRIAIQVNDMRTNSAETLNSQNRSFAAIEASTARIGDPAAVREVSLELRIPEQNNAINQANTSWEAKSSGALENLLARELHQSFNGDIVRHASMALRDGGEGTIKIALKPESLGNVKIALELSDNKITGKIYVESEEALNAFRREIASLEQAFKDSGFTAADLNLTLTSDGQNTGEWEDTRSVPQMFASRYEDNSEKSEVSLINVFIGHRKGSINMLA